MDNPLDPKILRSGSLGPIKWSVTNCAAWPDRFILRVSIHESAEEFHQGDLESAMAKARSMASGLYHLIQ